MVGIWLGIPSAAITLSASPSTGMLALCVANINWFLCLDYNSRLSSAQAMIEGLNFGSKMETSQAHEVLQSQ